MKKLLFVYLLTILFVTCKCQTFTIDSTGRFFTLDSIHTIDGTFIKDTIYWKNVIDTVNVKSCFIVNNRGYVKELNTKFIVKKYKLKCHSIYYNSDQDEENFRIYDDKGVKIAVCFIWIKDRYGYDQQIFYPLITL